METLEKRVLYSADPVLGALLDPHQNDRQDDAVAPGSEEKLIADEPDGWTTIPDAPTELIIVDVSHPEVRSLYTSLLEQFAGTNTEVISIGASHDVFAELSTILAQYSDLDAIHLLTHGSDGTLALGGEVITQQDLLTHAHLVEQWGDALTADGDLLLYGCNLSATDAGKQFALTMSKLMQADVASSDDLTGHASLGGDWDLEIEYGSLETDSLSDTAPLDDWVGKLDFTSNLVAHWKFDANGLDSAGPADARPVGTPYYSAGQIGNGINLQPSSVPVEPNDHLFVRAVDTPNFLGGEFTLSFWARPDTMAASTLIDQSDSNSGFRVEMNSVGRIFFYIVQPTGAEVRVTADITMASGTYNHVALTYASNEIRVTVNGIQKAQSISSSVMNDAPVQLHMGQDINGSGAFHGGLDEVRLYTRALTLADIIELGNYDGSSVNTEEQLAINTGFALSGGETATITNAHLNTNDAEQTDAELIYTVESSVAGITIVRNTTTLNINDTFTQQDINDGIVYIVHDGIVASAGDILLSVDDGFGTSTNFLMSVTADENLAPTDLVIVDSIDDTALSTNDPTGNDAYFTLPNAADLLGGATTLSFESRFETGSNPTNTTLFAYGANAADKQFAIELDQIVGLIVSIAGQSWVINSPEALSLIDGSERALAITWDSTTGLTNAYVDGIRIDSTTLATGLAISSTGTATLGNDVEANTNASFSGRYHDLRLFNIARTNEQIQQYIDTELSYNEPGLIGYWTFDSQSIDGIVGSEVGNHQLMPAISTQAAAVSGASQLNAIGVDEHTASGVVVGKVQGIDPEREALLANLLANDPDLYYSESLGIFLQVGNGRLSWDDAYAQAQTMSLNGVSGRLAMPNSIAENDFLYDTITERSLGRTWISASDRAVEGEYMIIQPGQADVQFSDAAGNSVNDAFVHWSDTEPNDRNAVENHVEIFNHNGMWNDVLGTKNNGNFYFAEYDAEEVLNGSNTPPGTNRSLSYVIDSQTTPGAFTIDPGTGEIRIDTAALIDVDVATTHTLSITTTDSSNLRYTEDVVINIIDIDEVNSHMHPASVPMDEDTSLTFSAAASLGVQIVDPDTNDIVTMTISASNGLLSLSQITNLTVTGGGNAVDASIIQVTGLVSDINQALNDMVYKPTSNYTGTDSIVIESVRAEDIHKPVNVAHTTSIDIAVNNTNDAPDAVDDTISIDEGASSSVLSDASTSLLNNDSDIDPGDAIVVTSNTQPAFGTVSTATDGTFVYTHDGSETTSDSFQYTIEDSDLEPGTATVNIVITPINDAPIATGESIQVQEGGSVSTVVGGATSLLANDSDPESHAFEVTNVSNPARAASLNVNFDGTFTYTHDGSESVSDSFTYDVVDALGKTSTATVSVSVIPTNDAPVAVDDAIIVAEGGTADQLVGGAISVNNNDSDDDDSWSSLVAVVNTQPSNGSLTLNSDGTFIYIHDGSETTSDSFTYELLDPSGAKSNVGTVSIAITPVNDIPMAANDNETLDEGDFSVILVLSNDADADLDSLTITNVTTPINGAAVINPGNTITYTHDGSETTSDTFDYEISDGAGGNATATVTINITPVNQAPVAVADNLTLDEGGNDIIDLTANDTDSEGSALTTTIVSTPTNGSLVPNPDGTYTYTHDGSETTSDSFAYQAIDSQSATSAITPVSITINPINDAPNAVNDGVTIDEGDIKVVPVLINDTDPELDALSVQIQTAPLNGTAIVNADNTITYTHVGDQTTSDSLIYAIDDGNGGISSATLLIGITTVNDAPVASTESFSLPENTSASLDILANDVDEESTTLTAIIVNQPTNGSLTLNPDGSYLYAHDGSETISDSFTYRVEDPQGATSATMSVSIDITPVNDPPVAVNDGITIDEGTTKIVPVLINDTDAELDSLSVQITTLPTNGVAIVNSDNTITYTHDGSNTTSDSLTYTIDDGSGGFDTATLLIAVRPINDDPIATSDSMTLAENTSATVDLLANDIDEESTNLTAIIVAQPTNGTLTQNPDGTYLYTHDGSETTSDSFTYRATDPQGASSSLTLVPVTITPVNDIPVAVNDGITIDEGTTKTVPVLINDSDAEQAALIVQIDTLPVNGVATVNSDYTITYTHDGSETSFDSLIYSIDDGNGGMGTATLLMAITPVNDAPVAATDSLSLVEGSSATIDVLVNDTDAENETLTSSITSTPNHGTLTQNNDGTYLYTHNGTETTSDSFSYLAIDPSNANSGETLVQIDIDPINDAPIANDDSLTLSEGGTATLYALNNDSDAESPTLQPVITVAPLHGTVVINADNSFSYSHDGSENHNDSFEYSVFDNQAAAAGAKVSIDITSINDNSPVITNLTAPLQIQENAANGSVIDTATATDTDINDSFSFTLTDNASGRFVISSSGTIAVADSSQLNHESDTQHTIDIKVTDSAGNSSTKTTTILVLDELEPIRQITTPASISISEFETANMNLGVVTTNVTDDSGTVQYALESDFNGLFSINPLTGQLSLSNASLLDYELQTEYNLAVNATDATGTTLSDTMLVSVLNVNEAPIATSPSQLTVSEVDATGISLGYVQATDPDNDTLSFGIASGNEHNAFAIDSLTGEILINDAAVIDFETTTQYQLVVNANDGALVTQYPITINVIDANEPPTLNTNNIVPVFTENADPVVISQFASIGDMDSSQLVKVELIPKNYHALEDNLHFQAIPGITQQLDTATGKVTLTGPASVNQFNAALAQLAYSNTSENPNTENRVFDLVMHDANNSVTARLGEVAVIEINDVATGSPIIIGDPLMGAQLQIDQSGLSDADGVTTYFYQWMRDGVDIVGATGPTFDITPVDATSELSVKVALQDQNDRIEPWFNSNTVSVAAPEPEPEPELQAAQATVAVATELASINEEFIVDVMAPIEQIVSTDTTQEQEQAPEQVADSTEDKIQSLLAAQATQQSSEVRTASEPLLSDDGLLAFNLPHLRAIVDARDILSSNLASEQTRIKTIQREIELEDLDLEEQIASLLLLESNENTSDEYRNIQWQSDNIGLKHSLNRLSDSLSHSTQQKDPQSAAAMEALVGISVGVTSGFLIWVLRGGALLASAFSLSPLWKLLDPLPIINSTSVDSTDEDNNEQDIEKMFDRRQKRID